MAENDQAADLENIDESAAPDQPGKAEVTAEASATDTGETPPEGSDGSNDAPTDSDDGDEPEKESRSAKRRRRAERNRLYKAEKEAAELKRKLEELERSKQDQQQPKPRFEDYDDIDDYEQALEAWVESKSAAKSESQQQKAESAASPLLDMGMTPSQAQDFVESTQSAAKRWPDYTDSVQAAASKGLFNDEVVMLVSEEDDPGELLYELAKSPETLQEIASASTSVQRAKRLGAFVARLEVKRTVPERIVSTAPAPVQTLQGDRRGGADGSIDYSKLSDEEFRARRRQEG